MRPAVYLLLCLCFYAAASLSQVLPFEYYTSKDGLVSNYTLALLQDSRAYLWVATNDGLTRYDGTNFRNYTPRDGLALSRVNCLCENRKQPGSLWIGTNGGGVNLYENDKFTTFRLGPEEWSNNVYTIQECSDGTVWCGTELGVYTLRNGISARVAPGIIGGQVGQIVEVFPGVLWVLTANGLFECRGDSVHPITLPANRTVTCLLADTASVWASTSDSCIVEFRNSNIVRSFRNPYPGSLFLLRDRSGTFWCGGNEGVSAARIGGGDTMQVVHYSTGNGLSEGYLVAGLVDREGDLWFGTYSKGLLKLPDRIALHVPIPDLYVAQNGSTAVADDAGHLWVCSNQGLREIAEGLNGAWNSWLHKSEPVTSLVFDPRGNILWTGSSESISGNEIVHSTGGLSVLRQVHRLALNGPPMCLLVDKDGYVWVSETRGGGVSLYDPRLPKPFLAHYAKPDGLCDNDIRAMYEDDDGNLWFGGYHDGLARLRANEKYTGRFTVFTTADGLPNNAIRSIIRDNEKKIWVGARYGGLGIFENSRFATFSLNDGLLSDAVWSLAKDESGMLLIGTQLGAQFLNPVKGSVLFSNNEMQGYPVYSCGVDHQERMWLVTPDGLTLLDRRQTSADTVPPPIYITRFQVNDEDVMPQKAQHLAYTQNNCRVEFTGISLKNAKAMRYRYKLLSVDEDWQMPTANRSVSFASLSPGSYTFVVEAINADGTPSALPAMVSFVIKPPFWREWWFFLLSATAVIAAVTLFVRFLIERALEIERIRRRIATDLHDDIGSGLTRIAILSDVASKQMSGGELSSSAPEDRFSVASTVEKVGSISRELVDAMGDVVWSIDPKHDTMRSLVQRVKAFAFEMCEAKNIRLQFLVDDGVEGISLSPERMRALLLISKEALANVAKHSNCTTAEYKLALVKQRLQLSICDDGKGFDAGSTTAGNGLGSMKSRAEKVSGNFSVMSGNGKGTTIVVFLPL